MLNKSKITKRARTIPLTEVPLFPRGTLALFEIVLGKIKTALYKLSLRLGMLSN
jgi:hypothetical protein